MKNIHQIQTLDELLIYLNSLHPKFIDFNLKRIKSLMKKLGNPEKKLTKTIHIAGTNGKGSTLAFTKHIAENHGLKVSYYSSPHLINFNERIVLNGKTIENKFLFEILKEVAIKNNNNKITFFEITTAAAFLAFSRIKSDLYIIETGLGGRLDATNIMQNKSIVAITNIGYDHKEFLGSKLKQIIYEKCGILNENTPTVISKQNTKYIKKNILYEVHKRKSQLLKLNLIPNTWSLGLSGDHQYNNAATAATIMKYLYKDLKSITIKNGLLSTKWPGRLQPIENGNIIKKRNNITLIDGAHNINGAMVIKNYLDKLKLGKWIVILGMMKNKDVNEFINIIQKNIYKLYLVPIENQKNCFKPSELLKKIKKDNFELVSLNNLEEATNLVPTNKPLLITGSLYLVGETLRKN